MTTVIPICFNCKHYEGKFKCVAFPENIPDDILTNEFDHIKKHPKQQGDILFEPIREK